MGVWTKSRGGRLGKPHLRSHMFVECPHPEKHGEGTAFGAKMYGHMVRERQDEPELKLWVYKCECGLWHITHLNKGHQHNIDTL